MRISNSFSEGEIQVMDFIVQTLLRGGSPNMATRHKEFASLCRKVMAMKGKVIEKQQKQSTDGGSEDDQGTLGQAVDQAVAATSVGTIDAPTMEAPKSSDAGLATAV